MFCSIQFFCALIEKKMSREPVFAVAASNSYSPIGLDSEKRIFREKRHTEAFYY